MSQHLIDRLVEEWVHLDPVDPLRGLISDVIAEINKQPAQQEPVAWVPYLSDRADGVKGHYAIARWNPRGYREVWNLRRHEWGAYSDDVLSLEEADTLLRLITIPTRKATSPQPAQQEPVAYEYGEEVYWHTNPALNDYIRANGKELVYATPPAAQPAPVQDDLADFIAGAFGVSRGTAYDMMREALKEAAPVQEPVAWKNAAIRLGEELSSVGPAGYYDMTAEQWLDWAMTQQPRGKNSLPAAQRQWVGLTDEEFIKAMPGGIYDCLNDPWDCGVGDGDTLRSIKKDVLRIARAIEAKLKEKNT